MKEIEKSIKIISQIMRIVAMILFMIIALVHLSRGEGYFANNITELRVFDLAAIVWVVVVIISND